MTDKRLYEILDAHSKRGDVAELGSEIARLQEALVVEQSRHETSLKELKILRAFVTKCHQMVDEDQEATIAEAMFDPETDHGDLQ